MRWNPQTAAPASDPVGGEQRAALPPHMETTRHHPLPLSRRKLPAGLPPEENEARVEPGIKAMNGGGVGCKSPMWCMEPRLLLKLSQIKLVEHSEASEAGRLG